MLGPSGDDVRGGRPIDATQPPVVPIEATMDANATQIAELVSKLLSVPDKLVTAQLYLRPISRGDSIAVNTENTPAHRRRLRFGAFGSR